MTKRELLEQLSDVPDDFKFVLSEYTIIDEDCMSVFDIPIRGIVVSSETNEIRFVCDSSSKVGLNELEGRNEG